MTTKKGSLTNATPSPDIPQSSGSIRPSDNTPAQATTNRNTLSTNDRRKK